MGTRTADPPLDEIQWKSSPDAAEMQGIHTNSVLHYFARSPFFDPTSNNAILVSQLQFNPRLQWVLANREHMEARLKTMSGLEFMVAQEPAEMNPGSGTGVWVIRKQTRRKRNGMEDELTIHATYFVVGENIYMAPTVGDVLGNRMLSVFSAMNSFLNIASTLSTFSPALGHTYLPPASTTRSKAEAPMSEASKETTPMPDSLSATQKRKLQASSSNTSYLDDLLLSESLRISLQYGDEYMDDNPVKGVPGDFSFTTTGRNKDPSKLVVPPPVKGPLQRPSGPPTPDPKSIELPKPERRSSGKGDKSPKVAGMPKVKRRKSRGGAANSVATTPK